MQHIGLSATEIATVLHREAEGWAESIDKYEQAALHAGMEPEQARQFAMVQYLQNFATELLEANNRKLAADLIRLGVIAGTIRHNGEPAF